MPEEQRWSFHPIRHGRSKVMLDTSSWRDMEGLLYTLEDMPSSNEGLGKKLHAVDSSRRFELRKCDKGFGRRTADRLTGGTLSSPFFFAQLMIEAKPSQT